MKIDDNLEPPVDKQYTLNGLAYKIGLHGLVYVWLDSAWKNSTKKVKDLEGKGIGRFRAMVE